MNEFYKEAREYDLLSFWSDVCRDKSVRDLMLKFEPQSGVDKKRKSRNVSKRKVSSDDDDIEEVPRAQTSKERLEMLMDQVEDEMSRPADQGDDLFAQGRDLGTRDLAGQRILQIATVIWNLSFEEDNALILSKNLTCLRFCLLCCSSQWRNLNQMGFDILCNVATEVYLGQGDEDCVTDVLLSTLTTCIGSNDRFQVLSSLNILNKLCQQEVNENYIETVLSDQRSVFDQLISYLSLQDIHLLINTLECLFSLSSLGEHSCNAIVRSHGALEALVSLITAEARGYGPKACVLMRVVETTTTPCHGQWQQAQQQAPQQQPQSVQQQQHPKQLQPQQLPPKVLPAPVSATNPIVVSSAGQAIAVAPGGGVVVRPQQQQVILQPQVLQQQQPGQQLGKPIAIQPAPQTLPAGSIVRMAGGQIIQTPQQPGTPQIVRGQLAQVPGGTPRQVLHLPRHPIPVRPAGGTPVQVVQQQQQAQVAQPQQIRPLMPGQQTPITTMGQPIRLQIQQPARPQIITQQAGQPQTIQRQPQPQSQPLQQPQLVGQQQQPQPQQTGSQAVQLRILNDEANRQFCLSWLKSTYELHSGNNIQHDMMYKQYLACLHKLYKTHVVSHQHYDACVR